MRFYQSRSKLKLIKIGSPPRKKLENLQSASATPIGDAVPLQNGSYMQAGSELVSLDISAGTRITAPAGRAKREASSHFFISWASQRRPLKGWAWLSLAKCLPGCPER